MSTAVRVMELQPGQRVTVRNDSGSRVECEFVRRISDRLVGPYLDEQTKHIPQAIVRYSDGTCELWPLELIEADGDRPSGFAT